jgi:hypothetical protein
MSFAVGDLVKVVKVDGSVGKQSYIGQESLVIRVGCGPYPYFLENIGCFSFSAYELEKIDISPVQIVPKVGDLFRIPGEGDVQHRVTKVSFNVYFVRDNRICVTGNFKILSPNDRIDALEASRNALLQESAELMKRAIEENKDKCAKIAEMSAEIDRIKKEIGN